MEKEVFSVLAQLGWNIHYCIYQADTCLALISQECPDRGLLILVTGDSDIIAYEDVDSVTMPMGKSHKLITITKTALLHRLELSSEKHLLLACLVTSNDYVRNIPHFGLRTNCELVGSMDLSGLSPLGIIDDNDRRADEIIPFVDEYIRLVKARLASQQQRSKSRKRKQQKPIDIDSQYYRHAIAAFVRRKETNVQEPIEDVDISPLAHDIVVSLLLRLYSPTQQQQQQRAPTSNRTIQSDDYSSSMHQITTTTTTADHHTTSGMDLDCSSSPTLSTSPPAPSIVTRASGTPKWKRSLKQQERRLNRLKQHRKNRKNQEKYQKWRQSKYVSARIFLGMHM
jgi:hypothetical protein